MAPAPAATKGRTCPAALSRALLRGDRGRGIPESGGGRAAGDRRAGRSPGFSEKIQLTPQEQRVAETRGRRVVQRRDRCATLRQSAHCLLPPAEGLHEARRAVSEAADPRGFGRGSRSAGDESRIAATLSAVSSPARASPGRPSTLSRVIPPGQQQSVAVWCPEPQLDVDELPAPRAPAASHATWPRPSRCVPKGRL